MSDIYGAIFAAKAQENRQTEETAERALAAIKAAEVVSMMPNPTLPRTGLLLMVHPDVYARVREACKEEPSP